MIVLEHNSQIRKILDGKSRGGQKQESFFFFPRKKTCLKEQEKVSSRDLWISDDSEHSHNNSLFPQGIKFKVAQRIEILLFQDLSGNTGREEWVPVKFIRPMKSQNLGL